MNRATLVGVALLVALVAVAGVVPGAWGGADGEAEETIGEVAPEYEPWFSPIWTPPSGEIESLLFSLQAGLGGAVIGYYVGAFGRNRNASNA